MYLQKLFETSADLALVRPARHPAGVSSDSFRKTLGRQRLLCSASNNQGAVFCGNTGLLEEAE
jgi:hypothetical protein